MQWPWQRPKPEPARVETPIGEFVRLEGKDADWEALIDAAGTQVQVLAADEGGVPDPGLLGQMPFILGNLPLLEKTARAEVTAVSDRHLLDSISSALPGDSDFVLGFSYNEEVWGETVFVDFKGRQVVGWSTVD